MKSLPLPSLFACCLLVFGLSTSTFGQVIGPQANLLTNPDFEQDLKGWDLTAWGNVKIIAQKDDKQRRAGKPSLRIEQPEMADASMQQEVNVKPSTRYRLSGWIKTERVVKPEGEKQRGGVAGACLCVMGGYDGTTSFIASTTNWSHVSVDFSSGNKTSLRIAARMGHYGKLVTGTAWFSEISLVELGAAANSGSPPVASPPPPPATVAPAPVAATYTTSPAASELVKKHRNNLVFVKGTNGSGSGFFAKYGNRTFLFTNAHVAVGVKGAGFRTLDGTEVKAGEASMAVGHDIFLFQAAGGTAPFETMMGVEERALIGDEIVVLGNAEGAGVINTITGKIVGLGPQLVEVDAPFVSGNSGSPIIHLKSGQVIGVATYLIVKKLDPATRQPMANPVVRRFGYRLDSVKTWQPVAWPALHAQAAEMDAIEKLTDDLGEFLGDLSEDGRVTRGAHSHPAIRNRIDAWLDVKSRRLSARDATAANQSFLSFLRLVSQNDLAVARPRLTYDYFQRQIAEQQQTRDQMTKFFNEVIKDLASAR